MPPFGYNLRFYAYILILLLVIVNSFLASCYLFL
nr:MAG TPA_asm: hypothetical protein [Caudoviricetes sp.]